jgi:hypothetical protein
VKRAELKRRIGLSSGGAELSSVDAMSAWPSAVSSLKQDITKGENPVFLLLVAACTTRVLRVELFGIAALSRW